MKNIKNKKVWRWIAFHGKRSVPVIALMTVLTVFMSLISLYFTVVSKSVMDIATNQGQGRLFDECIKLAALLAVQLLVQISVNFINVKAAAGFSIDLKTSVFKKLMSKDYESVSKYHSGELLNRLVSDTEIITNGIVSVIPNAALLITSIAGGFILLYSLDRFFALLILACGPVLFAASRMYSKRYKQLHKDCQESSGKSKSFMQEILQNILVVKSFNGTSSVVKTTKELQYTNYRFQLKRTKASIVAHVAMYIAFNAGYYFALGYGAWRLSAGAISVGTVMAMVQLVGRIQTPFKDISSMIPMLYSVSASAERLIELEELTDEVCEAPVSTEDVYRDMESIVVKDLSFAYNEDNGISHMDLTIEKGITAAIAGESGAGKSTLIKLLLAIYRPDGGEIYIKTSRENIPVSTATRCMFSYVPQGNLILSGTIRDNITFAKPGASTAETEKACRAAGIWDFICSQEQGLDTVIGEKGLGLSEGQAQRISIARAVLYDAPILLLDEATSALDSATEAELIRSIKRMTDKTCIIVSHKPAVLEACDKVIYVDKTYPNSD